MDYKSHTPDKESLLIGLDQCLSGVGYLGNGVEIASVTREINIFCSTYASEVIHCTLNNGADLQIHSKYSGDVEPWGHHRGVAYEGKVYSGVLQHVPLTSPRFYGSYHDPDSGSDWLFIEHIEESMRLYTSTESMVPSAHWLGQFHAFASGRIGLKETAFLESFGEDYFRHWVGRTAEYTRHLGSEFDWARRLCEKFLEKTDQISRQELTITHGEFYPKNILVSRGDIFPVDWESAVIARGEMDLASLVEGWGNDVVEECKAAYTKSRWPHGAPNGFELVFGLARIFWPLRWLGDRDDWDLDDFAEKYFDRLREEAMEQGLM